MFAILAGIFVYFLIVVLLIYRVRPGHGLSHMPTTLAATYTLLYASNISDEFSRIYGEDPKKRAKQLEKLGNTYGYRGFVGLDGQRHFGVYREEPSQVEKHPKLGGYIHIHITRSLQ